MPTITSDSICRPSPVFYSSITFYAWVSRVEDLCKRAAASTFSVLGSDSRLPQNLHKRVELAV